MLICNDIGCKKSGAFRAPDREDFRNGVICIDNYSVMMLSVSVTISELSTGLSRVA